MAYPSHRLLTWGIVLGGIAIAAWNGLPNPLAPFPGKSLNRGAWRLYYHGELSAEQANRYCEVLEANTPGIQEAWLLQTGKSWDAVLFVETERDVEHAEAEWVRLELELKNSLGNVGFNIKFRVGHPELKKIWIM